MTARAPSRIAVRLPNWTGDVVMATPGLRALRARHPEAHIAAFLPRSLMPLLDGAPWIDEVCAVDHWRAGVGAWWRGVRAVRRGRFELGICLPDSISSALVFRAGGVARVAGHQRGFGDRLLHLAVAPESAWGSEGRVARERKVLHLLAALGVAGRGLELELYTTPAEEQRARQCLAPLGALDPLAVLAPGASFGPSKCWPPESFAKVGDALVEHGAKVVVVGTAAERERCTRVCSEMTRDALDLGGELDLGALKAVLRRAALLVCNDAGARHVAVAFGTPAIVAFGPTSVAKTDCNLERVTVLEEQVECRPCYQRECPIDHRCLERIEPQRAITAALALLREPSAVAAAADGAAAPTEGR